MREKCVSLVCSSSVAVRFALAARCALAAALLGSRLGSRPRGSALSNLFYRRTSRRCHACTAAAHAPPGCKKLSFDLWRAVFGGMIEAPPRMPPAPEARALPLEGRPEGTLISRGDTAAAHRMIPWNGSCKHCVFSLAWWSLRWYFSCRLVTRILVVQGPVYG